jgi:GrpB-like predicted nucleotidyltransferase (UPF0157 family)
MHRTIDVVPYDPAWPEEFARERDRIRNALGDVAVRIEHNGSTAVPGLSAKPVIDIQISVAALHPMDLYERPLAALGYTHVPHEDDAWCPFFHRPADWPHTHHVHVVAAGDDEERRTLAFRDYLRAHPDAAREYEALKRRLADRFNVSTFDSQQAYADGKTEFVGRILAQARGGDPDRRDS